MYINSTYKTCVISNLSSILVCTLLDIKGAMDKEKFQSLKLNNILLFLTLMYVKCKLNNFYGPLNCNVKERMYAH